MKHFYSLLPLCFFSLFCPYLHAQINYTANDQVTPYKGRYRAGINMGYYPGWDNRTLSDVAAGNPAVNIPGIGARSNRVGLQEIVLDYFGYDLVKPDFKHWKSLGMDEFVAFTSGPIWAHQDKTEYCPGYPSSMFANMYLTVWDGGKNGTPYNDDNYYAAYLYKTVSQYKDEVRFWEVWNEPGFDLTGNLGWRDENYPGNWWLEGPNPCDNILRAPIYNYIRALHIAWEVIKTVDPDAYVCLSSVGYLSFLNAVLRNTDNPNAGDISGEFPLLGGAYFDCIAIHSYPHFDGSTINQGINYYQRHSDQAADGLLKVVNDYQAILDKYGYNGITFPKKEWICTEINSPRTVFTGPFFGGKDAQINHMMKAHLLAKIYRVHQLHSYQLFDQKTEQESNYEFHQMGMYKKIDGQPPYSQAVNDLGIAMKTLTDLVFDTEFDSAQTALLNLPPTVRGYAWRRPDSTYIYALWARTTQDLSENAFATYSFPPDFKALNWKKYDWHYGYTAQTSIVGNNNIALDARPVFFTLNQLDPCQIRAFVVATECSPDTTPDNPYDDQYVATIAVSGLDNSTTYTATLGSQNFQGSFGEMLMINGIESAAGKQQIQIISDSLTECIASLEVMPPEGCLGQPCSPGSTFPWHDWIERVQFGSLDNSSSKTPYSDFTGLSTDVFKGDTVIIALTSGFSWFTYDEKWKVWIDYNQNGLFEEPLEVAYAGIQPKPVDGTLSFTHTGAFTIPVNAPTGAARMRISMSHTLDPKPCSVLPDGEVEDYTVNIKPRVVSVHNSQAEATLRIYPNPASEQVWLDLRSFNHQKCRLAILDGLGRRISDMVIPTGSGGLVSLPLNNLPNGTYGLLLYGGSKIGFAKLTVVK